MQKDHRCHQCSVDQTAGLGELEGGQMVDRDPQSIVVQGHVDQDEDEELCTPKNQKPRIDLDELYRMSGTESGDWSGTVLDFQRFGSPDRLQGGSGKAKVSDGAVVVGTVQDLGGDVCRHQNKQRDQGSPRGESLEELCRKESECLSSFGSETVLIGANKANKSIGHLGRNPALGCDTTIGSEHASKSISQGINEEIIVQLLEEIPEIDASPRPRKKLKALKSEGFTAPEATRKDGHAFARDASKIKINKDTELVLSPQIEKTQS